MKILHLSARPPLTRRNAGLAPEMAAQSKIAFASAIEEALDG